MAMTLKLSKTKTLNPSTKKMGYRTTVKSNGKADMDSLVLSASKNTTMHKAELRMAFELALDAIRESLAAGKIVELKGIGNIGFTCSGAWTETPEEQTAVEHKIGVALAYRSSQAKRCTLLWPLPRHHGQRMVRATSLPLPTHRASRNHHRRLRVNGSWCEIKNIVFDGLNGCRNEKVTTNITNNTNNSCDLCHSLLKEKHPLNPFNPM